MSAIASTSARFRLGSGRADGRALARGLLVATLVATGGLLSGCASYERDHFVVGSVPDDYRTRHPIVVSQSEATEDIVVSAHARKMSVRDRGVVDAFASRYRQSGAKEIAILIPSGSRNEAAARRVAYDVAHELGKRGVPERRIRIQHYNAAGYGDAAAVRLAFADLKARVDSQCGQWNDDIVDTDENRNYRNFGCATQQNLAAIVANPADLLGPRGESEIDSTRRTNVINDWQDFGSDDLPTLFEQ